jgi:polar amino acid transport system substrate-binding protein
VVVVVAKLSPTRRNRVSINKFFRCNGRWLVAGLAVFCLTGGAASAQEKSTTGPLVNNSLPLFRHIDPSAKAPDFKAYPILRFVVTDDFPPFSYRNKNAALTGFNVAIANTICKVLRVECRFVVKPFDEARAIVEKGQAEALITGLTQNSETEKQLSFTRPYYRFSARFAMRQAMTIKSGSTRDLAGKRLGVIAGTMHEQFLNASYQRSKIRGFESRSDAYEALRTGAVDALFDDSLKLMFWLKGGASKDCCQFVGGAYFDPASFSRPMSIAVKRGNVKLRKLLDHGLDRLQISGRFSKIFYQYFPLSPWSGS